MPDGTRGLADMQVRALSGSCGAEVRGIDLTSLDDEGFAAVRETFLSHKVLCFRDQKLDEETLMAFGLRFGPLIVHPNLMAEGKHPEVIAIRKEPGDKAAVGENWHTDTTCLVKPPLGSALYALEVPPAGGDTLFADQQGAWDMLSDGMKATLSGMRAVHNDTRVAGPATNFNALRSTRNREDDAWTPTECVHPVVRTHPETGRKGLFVNRAYTIRFEGMTEAESTPLLDYLYAVGERVELTCRVSWEPGSLTLWDNRCLKHAAINDYPGHRREMRRIQIEGDRPS